MSIKPPANSAFDLYLLPKIFPIYIPAAEKAPVVRPIISTADQILAFRKANDTPTARASMLVATAIASIVRKEKSGSVQQHSSFSKDSFTILPPIIPRRTNAIQWSTLDTMSANATPAK